MKKYLPQNAQASLLWFGVGISVVEILTGMQLASLDLSTALFSIVTGLFIGAIFLFGVGYIGAREKLSGMESTAIAFGQRGSLFFAFLNVLQLIGWIAVMLQAGASTTVGLFPELNFSPQIWAVLIALGVAFWLVTDIKGVHYFHVVVLVSLFLLSSALLIQLLSQVFGSDIESALTSESAMPVGVALDLVIVLPLAWTPLIADYTKNAVQPFKYSLFSAIGYFFGSLLMFLLGYFAGHYIGTESLTPLFSLFAFSSFSLFVVFFSTVTTDYINVYSASESFLHLTKIKQRRPIALILLGISTCLAVFVSSEYYENFLYLIASVFIPMLTILLVEYYVLKNTFLETYLNRTNMIIWAIGFLLSQYAVLPSFVWGLNISLIIAVAMIKYLVNIVFARMTNGKNS